MGILEISSSEDDNPNDMSLREGTDIIVPSVGMNREGRHSILKPQPTIQSGCKTRLTACSDLSSAWRINTVQLEYNHKTSPSKSRLYRGNREISARVRRQLEINDVAGIPLHKSFNSTVVEAGGYENITCIEKDCRNFIDKVQRLRLGEGDALAIQAYFTKMQACSPGFFFSIDLDDEARLRNVFWADNRCRQACKKFGDIVTFDTTYLTNKYEMSFAPFVGVSHRGQSTLLGCGLLSNEDTRTFVWVFETWLECMRAQASCGIITDQDRTMQNAIEIVFPNTKHRWCLWHILKKLPEKFGGHRHKASIIATIHALVYDMQSCEEFEQGWNKMLVDYDLLEHAWLTSLYNERGRWVPCFLKTSFWAGMSTTQRSEGINAFFDGYVHSKTSLIDIKLPLLLLFMRCKSVEQYERALRSKVEKEFQADFKSFSQMAPYVTRYEMERQFQLVYTIAKFKEFKEQFTGKVYCEVLGLHETYLHTTYDVREDISMNNCMKTKIFKVCFRRDECKFECSCHLFEFRVIICKHAITILIRNQVHLVPEKYILRRWRRDVNRLFMRVPITYDGWISTPNQIRYKQICNAFMKLADFVAHDELRSRGIMDWIEIQTNDSSMLKYSSVGSQRLDEAGKCASGIIFDPKYTKSKGAPKKLRRKGCLEAGSRKSNISRKMANSATWNREKDKVSSSLNVQQQYRECDFKKYSELISCLFVAEQNNELLIKNHGLRPTGSILLPEANGTVLLEANAISRQGHGHGRGHGFGCGRGRARGVNHGQNNRQSYQQ
ncbi:protein FAR1-RELATED SEQUENCE 5-like [Olea europaea var. sylvestris]|uniref:protein FAR1-RELATED SEQUENCE 5-like n=1 Tax=Olea europaea var. sylvestris TaxID=158386 RepID=UPI000C1D561C|nr:protein FAR1-RELATED SEQUENCE 5-like [Olea europaea var. sylvestris]